MVSRQAALPLTYLLSAMLVLLYITCTAGQENDIAIAASGAAAGPDQNLADTVEGAGGMKEQKANAHANYKHDTLFRGKSGFEAMGKKDKDKLDTIASKHGKSTEQLRKEMEEDNDLAIDPDHENLMYICEGLAVDGVAGEAGVVAAGSVEGTAMTDVATASVASTTSAFVDSQVRLQHALSQELLQIASLLLRLKHH